jgi:peptidoglycan/LPS O-acetylase OafA/YrhL
MNWQRAHWITGTAALVIFVLTGAYMRWVRVPHVPQLDDVTRAVYRSRHLFLLLSAGLNLAFALAPSAKRRSQQVVSVLVLAAPALFLAAFAVEPAHGIYGAPFSQIALYLLFGAAVILVCIAR